jgi:uncharacterized membrane protein
MTAPAAPAVSVGASLPGASDLDRPSNRPFVESSSRRFDSIDLVRGIVMVIMLLDHTRDFTHASGFMFDALDNERSNPMLYFTRWITHLCAPTFVLLAGTSSGIQRIRGTPAPELARFLFTRGLWLVIMEFTLVRLVTWWNVNPNMLAMLQVIWVIGVSMMVLAALVRLPMRVVGMIGLAIIVGHNALDAIQVAGFRGPASPMPGTIAKLWMVLHQGGVFPIAGFPGPFVLAFYPLLPWIGVLLAGYGLAELYAIDASRRRSWLLGIAAAMLVTFVVLRTGRIYGDPIPWSVQPTTARTIMSYMNVQKYGPSLLFVCATLFWTVIGLRAFDGRTFSNPIARAFVTYGRVPFFFYLLQWVWAKVAGIAVALAYGRSLRVFFINPVDTFSTPITEHGGPLWITWLCWLLGAIVLYFPCRWYAEVKARRKDLAILRYL